jgi:outer membrane lipoprotein-sorting protein
MERWMRSDLHISGCQGDPVKPIVSVVIVLSITHLFAQQPQQQEFTDPMVLLQVVAKNYASAVNTFRLESITDLEISNELNRQWNRTYRVAIKGPGRQYRIDVRTAFGSLVQVSDGVNEWVYQVESNSYVRRPLPTSWPTFPKVMDMEFSELGRAWNGRTSLEDEAFGYKRATMLPEETIVIEGHRFPCYVVRTNSDDSIRTVSKDLRADNTYWIDKQALVFRKIRRISDGSMMVSRSLHLPLHSETTETYPTAEINPKTTSEMFRFAPPADAKEVTSLEPDFGGASPSIRRNLQSPAAEFSGARPSNEKLQQ